jgi:hypothetical protein
MSGEIQMAAPVEHHEEGPAASALEQWGRDAATIYNVAINLVKTSFVPAAYQGNAFEAVAAILTGQEIGLQPMASLRSIDIISGVPAMRAVLLRAVVQSAGHEIWTVESTRTRAVVKGQRRGSDKVETSEWTIERATQLGLHTKDNWKKQPIAMLLARATSECARLVAADELLGIPYSTEEMQDLAGDVPAVGVEGTAKRATRTVKRAALDPAANEPPLEHEEPKPETPVEQPAPERDESAIADAARAAFEEEPWEPAVPEGDALI